MPVPSVIAAQEKLDPAVEEITAYTEDHPASFTGLRVCPSSGTLFVYRVAGDHEFDSTATAAARRHDVLLVLRDAPYAQAALERVRADILAHYRDDLDRAGAQWLSAGISRRGFVEIGVLENFDEARAVLAEFGDRVHVVQGHETVTL